MGRPGTLSWNEHEWPQPLTAELATRIAVSVEQALGFWLQPEDVETLHYGAVQAGSENFAKMPALPTSRDALRELIMASNKLVTAIRKVYELAYKAPPLNRFSLVDPFLWESSIILGDPSRVWIPTERLIDRISHDLEELTERAHRILADAPLASRGTSRKIAGLDIFVDACHRVWTNHRTDKGWSKKNGRGAGHFVRFVNIVQPLLPPELRKTSEAAVGDAVLAVLGNTKSKKTFVP
jgi:hypothetical protein